MGVGLFPKPSGSAGSNVDGTGVELTVVGAVAVVEAVPELAACPSSPE
jgi:hypothetical protein